jgi:hypothetical protein
MWFCVCTGSVRERKQEKKVEYAILFGMKWGKVVGGSDLKKLFNFHQTIVSKILKRLKHQHFKTNPSHLWLMRKEI